MWLIVYRPDSTIGWLEMDLGFPSLLAWAAALIGILPVAVGLGWGFFDSVIRPRLIPRAEIHRLADELMERHGGRAGEIAHIEEDRAWRNVDGREQGKWRRVREEIERRPG